MAVSATHNRVFLIGLGVSTCLVINFMRRMLSSYRDAAIDPPEKQKSKFVDQKVEDSLMLGTLDKLLESPNYSIHEIASIIICERALHDAPTVESLFQYITQPNYETREKGVRALRIIMNSSRAVKEVASPEFYMAIMKSLEYSITDYKHHDYDYAWDNWHLRDIAERGCLMILGQCVRETGSVDGLVKARFVDRWLAKEPWGVDDSERQANFVELLNKRHYRLHSICEALFYNSAGRKHLENAKLVPVLQDQDLDGVDVRMVNGESTAGEEFEEELFVESRRPRDQTVEEEHLRRRHREAMVLNDGTTPLGRGDIFERPR